MAKQLSALQARLGGQQVLFAVTGAVITDAGLPIQALHADGVIAGTPTELHFFRQRRRGIDHLVLHFGDVDDIQLPTLQISDDQAGTGLLLETSTGNWVVVTPDDERDLVLRTLAALRVAGISMGPPEPSAIEHGPADPAVDAAGAGGVEPAGRSSSDVPPEAAPESASRPALTSPQGFARKVGVAAAAGAVAVVVTVVLLAVVARHDDGAMRSQRAGTSGGASAGDVTASGGLTQSEAPSPAAADPDDAVADEPPSPATTNPVAGDTQQVVGDNWVADAPATNNGWRLGDTTTANRGRQIIRHLRGPHNAVITIVHTPRFEARPDPAYEVDEFPLQTRARDSRLVILEDFPSDGCRGRRCSDFVLNDPAYGGLAILANGEPGDEVFRVADVLARTVRPAGPTDEDPPTVVPAPGADESLSPADGE